jgi:hypothetical protein
MEANPGELQFITVYQQVPKEEDMMEMIRALKDQHGDWHLATGRH